MNQYLSLRSLPSDMVIVIAQFVYGEKKVVVRKDGHVSFRILKIEPCLSKIRKFSVYLSFDSHDSISRVSSKTVFLGNKMVHNQDIGWSDITYAEEEDSPLYRRTEYTLTIRKNTYEFVSSAMLYSSEHWGRMVKRECSRRLVQL